MSFLTFFEFKKQGFTVYKMHKNIYVNTCTHAAPFFSQHIDNAAVTQRFPLLLSIHELSFHRQLHLSLLYTLRLPIAQFAP